MSEDTCKFLVCIKQVQKWALKVSIMHSHIYYAMCMKGKFWFQKMKYALYLILLRRLSNNYQPTFINLYFQGY